MSVGGQHAADVDEDADADKAEDEDEDADEDDVDRGLEESDDEVVRWCGGAVVRWMRGEVKGLRFEGLEAKWKDKSKLDPGGQLALGERGSL